MRLLGRRRWFLATVLGAALAAPFTVAQAQTGKLTGTVTDAETGRPIEGASVTIQGTTLGNITSSTGKFFIIQVPPGVYTVQARRIGYIGSNMTDVQVNIDFTRDVTFKLKASANQLTAVTVKADQVPLIEKGQIGSGTTITQDQIQSLPVTSIAGVLALQAGFQEVGSNTSVISLQEENRSTSNPVRIRGSRGGSTLSMIDGVPINNPVFGSNAITLGTFSTQQTDFKRGQMDPQYGNALSGIINSFVREGGTEVTGSINFQNSTLPGAIFNSKQDQLLGNNLLRGYLAGPVPGTSAKVRYSVSGQVQSAASSVLQFDNDIFSVNTNVEQLEVLPAYRRDLIKGWQAFGGTQDQQLVGKLTFLPFDKTKINFTAIGAETERHTYARSYLFSYAGDPLKLVNNRADSLYVINDQGFVLSPDLSHPRVRNKSNMYVASLDQRFGRSNLQVRVGQTDFERQTCPEFLGTCLPAPFCLANFTQGFVNPSPSLCSTTPDQGNQSSSAGGASFGGERFTDRTIRVDLQSQVTDHNNLQMGVQYTAHDIKYAEQISSGGNSGIAAFTNQVYRAKPYDAAGYVQSVIEYDFLTIHLGGRFDYGVAKGLGFTDPFDPANHTTAREVCNGATVGGQKLVNAAGQPYGLDGCFASPQDPKTKRPVLLDSATRIAQLDDFSPAKARTAFSPRIGVNFPLTEKSQVFFNAGRYTKVPNYHDVYRNTGVGVIAGSADGYCTAAQVKPGTNECVPDVRSTNPTFIGNPNLLLEESKSFEVGYSTSLGAQDNYGLSLAVYNRSESGLTGVRNSRAGQDIGSTYDGSAPSYTVAVNGDFLSARGMEINLERRLTNRWSYTLNYTLSRSTTNSVPPDRADEINRNESNRKQSIETVTDANRTHAFNATFGVAVRNDIPSLPLNLGRFLRNTRVNTTWALASGIPYTPVRATSLAGTGTTNAASDVNSGHQPYTSEVGLVIDKQFRIRNMSYSGFFRVSNLFDRKNCAQVFTNTGTCDSGLRDFANRRIGNTGDVTTSTGFDQPEYIAARRSLFTGLTINF